MARRGLSEDERLQRAIVSGRRMALGGDRPTYQLRQVPGGYRLVELEQVIAETDPLRAVDAAGALVAQLLDVPRSAFDVEIERSA